MHISSKRVTITPHGLLLCIKRVICTYKKLDIRSYRDRAVCIYSPIDSCICVLLAVVRLSPPGLFSLGTVLPDEFHHSRDDSKSLIGRSIDSPGLG